MAFGYYTITRRKVARGQKVDHGNFCHKDTKPGPVIYSMDNYTCMLCTLIFWSLKTTGSLAEIHFLIPSHLPSGDRDI